MSTEHILPISGYRDHAVPNRLRQPDRAIGHLAMLLPGYGYTLDMPLFYYLESLCLDTGCDVLRVETAYNQNSAFRDAPESEQAKWVASDARTAWHAGLAQGRYASALVVGKSLGTLGLAALLAEPLGSPGTVRSVWLTPLLSEPSVRQALLRLGDSAQVVIGDADPPLRRGRAGECRRRRGKRSGRSRSGSWALPTSCPNSSRPSRNSRSARSAAVSNDVAIRCSCLLQIYRTLVPVRRSASVPGSSLHPRLRPDLR